MPEDGERRICGGCGVSRIEYDSETGDWFHVESLDRIERRYALREAFL